MSKTQLDAYAASITSKTMLGHIAWYSLPDPHITKEDIDLIADTSGIKKDHLPGEPRPSDAFKRAIRKTDLLKTKYVEVPNSNNKLSVMVRPVVASGRSLEAHLVIETLDSAGKRLSHEDAVAFKFDVDNGVFDVKELIDPMPHENLVGNRVKYFTLLFQLSCVEVEPQAIRNTFRQELWDMNALNVRSRGGIYFVPKSSNNDLEKLELFATTLGAEFHTLPLPDTSKQKDMVMAAFENDVHAQAHETIEKLNKVLLKGEKIPPSVWARYKSRLDDLTSRTAQYSDIVDTELEKAGTELILLQQKVMEVLKGNLIVEGRTTR